MRNIGSRTTSRTMVSRLRFCCAGSSFGPSCSKRARASASRRPTSPSIWRTLATSANTRGQRGATAWRLAHVGVPGSRRRRFTRSGNISMGTRMTEPPMVCTKSANDHSPRDRANVWRLGPGREPQRRIAVTAPRTPRARRGTAAGRRRARSATGAAGSARVVGTSWRFHLTRVSDVAPHGRRPTEAGPPPWREAGARRGPVLSPTPPAPAVRHPAAGGSGGRRAPVTSSPRIATTSARPLRER